MPPNEGFSGYVNWSLTTFTLEKLVDGNTFPAFAAHELQLYDMDGEVITRDPQEGGRSGEDGVLYLPYINFTCLLENLNLNEEDLFIEPINITGISVPNSVVIG